MNILLLGTVILYSWMQVTDSAYLNGADRQRLRSMLAAQVSGKSNNAAPARKDGATPPNNGDAAPSSKSGAGQAKRQQFSRTLTAVNHTTYMCYKGATSISRTVKKGTKWAHNQVRALHGVANLIWNASLAETAQAHADWMAENNYMNHSSTSNGENVAFNSISINPCVHGVAPMLANWYNEIANWNFATSSSNGGVTGHYTAMVWNATEELGCGMASSVDADGWEKTFLACQYYPAGNMQTEFANNVFEPSDSTTKTQVEMDFDGECDFLDPDNEDINDCADYKEWGYCSYLTAACTYTCP